MSRISHRDPAVKTWRTQSCVVPHTFPVAEPCIKCGAVPLDRGRRPRRPLAIVESLVSRTKERVQGDPRRPGGLPHEFRRINQARRRIIL
jgi:hypothetical protein